MTTAVSDGSGASSVPASVHGRDVFEKFERMLFVQCITDMNGCCLCWCLLFCSVQSGAATARRPAFSATEHYHRGGDHRPWSGVEQQPQQQQQQQRRDDYYVERESE